MNGTQLLTLNYIIYCMYNEKSKSEKIKLANTLYGPLRLSRFEEMFVTWQNRRQGRRSPLILYQLTLPDPLFVSSLLSAGDASQNTIPLGECLCHLVCLSVCVWEWLSCWFVCDSLQSKWPSGVFKSRLSPSYYGTWCRTLFCHGDKSHTHVIIWTFNDDLK